MIDHEVKRAFEELEHREKSVGIENAISLRMYAAVLILREIAFSMPTFFFQNTSKFFNVIWAPLWDGRRVLRESSANAIRAALVVTAQRESAKQSR